MLDKAVVLPKRSDSTARYDFYPSWGRPFTTGALLLKVLPYTSVVTPAGIELPPYPTLFLAVWIFS